MIPKPQPSEYPAYYEKYINNISESTHVLDLLKTQQQELVQLFARVSEGESNFAYEPGKWTIKELLGHMNDTERIMAYRALCFARGEQQPLPGFDENDYVLKSNFAERSLTNLVEEHHTIRAATLSLFSSLSETALARIGNANGNPMTVAALAFIIAGHERHHLNILKERYLAKL